MFVIAVILLLGASDSTYLYCADDCRHVRIFRSPIAMKPQNVDTAILAALVLHYFLMTKNETDNSDFSYGSRGFADVEKDDGSFTRGQWRKTVNRDNSALSGGRFVGNRSADDALEIRDEFMRYFINEGKIPWQHAAVTKGSSELISNNK